MDTTVLSWLTVFLPFLQFCAVWGGGGSDRLQNVCALHKILLDYD